MAWLAAGQGYEIALVQGRVAARATTGRSAGRQLKTLPKALRDDPEVDRLRRLAEWLDRHAAGCVAQVDAWMVSSLPVPTALVARVWPDEAGFLRGVAEDGGLRVVNLDGETVRLSPQTVTLPHPVLLPDLDDLREFAAELGVEQRVEQIYRATWRKPEDPAEDRAKAQAARVTEFSGGRFPSRFILAARATSLGYKVSGGFANCRVRDEDRTVEASVWIGEPYWDEDSETGALTWHSEDGSALAQAAVGPVAWSEGMRMAAALYAGRVIEEGKDA